MVARGDGGDDGRGSVPTSRCAVTAVEGCGLKRWSREKEGACSDEGRAEGGRGEEDEGDVSVRQWRVTRGQRRRKPDQSSKLTQ